MTVTGEGSDVHGMRVSAAENLECACRLIDICHGNDHLCSDLHEKLRLLPRIDVPTFSGLGDPHYVSLDNLGLGEKLEYIATGRHPIPQELLDQFLHMQCNCCMGLFPEVSRAWVSVDSDIFIWNYETGTDLAYFDGLPNTVVAIGLVRPKPSLFQPHIQYLLCVATAVDVVLLAVNFSDVNGTAVFGREELRTAEMHLLPDPLFKVPLDGAIVSDICCCRNGRIFLGSRDGCLYELDYGERGWFRRQCKKLNHSKGVMSYLVPSFVSFVFGADDSGPGQQQQQVPSETKSQEAARPLTLRLLHVRLPPGFTASTMLARPQNVHISWTDKECFVFSSATNDDSDVLWGFSCSNFPFHREMIESVSQLPIQGRTWAIRCGNCLVSDYFDELWRKQYPKSVLPVLPSNTVLQHTFSVEKIILLTAQGVHHIEKLRPVDLLRHLLEEFGPDSHQVKSFFQLHQADQACEMCCILACSTTAHDQYNVKEKAVRAMFTFGGDPQITFPSERVLPGQGVTNGYVSGANSSMADWSQLPGSPLQASTPQSQSPFRPVGGMNGYVSPRRDNFVFPGAFQQQQQQLPIPLTSGVVQSPVRANQTPPLQCAQYPEIKYSNRHNGLYLSFARIVGPLWNMRMVLRGAQERGNLPLLDSALTSEELTWFLDQLKRLKDFFDQHSLLPSAIGITAASSSPAACQLSVGPSSPRRSSIHQRMLRFMRPEPIDSVSHARQQLSRKNKAEAVAAERVSLIRLYEITERCCEVLELWKILADHSFGALVSQLPVDIREMLQAMTLRQLIVKGKELCADLITCLIRYHLSDETTTDEISARLRRVCPGLYTSDDATVAKASELLQSARTMEEGQRKEETLQQALRLYKKVAQQIHISTVCAQFQEDSRSSASHMSTNLTTGDTLRMIPFHDAILALFFDGIVELVLCCADRSDPQGLGLAYYKNRNQHAEQSSNSQLRISYLNRLSYYTCITELLDKLNSGTRDPSLTSQMAEMLAEDILKKALDSTDELCHVAIYEWMLERNLAEKLLHVNSPYLENYLQSKVCDGGQLTDGLLDLLWQFYERENRFMQAADLLSKLAERHSTRVDLNRRLTYLSRAVMCAKSAPDVRADRGAFLQELEDKLEVARLQMQVLDSLKQLKIRPSHVKDAISQLNANLMDVTQLYTDYADQFSLPECKLAIVHCAGHCETGLVQTLWREIVEKELTLSKNDTVDTRMKRMETKLLSLSRLYSSTPRYFPKEFLLKMLQLKSFENEFLPEWLAKLLEQMGIAILLILDLLDQLYKQPQSIWRTNTRAQAHLLTIILSVINNFAERPSGYPLDERRKILTKCTDVISSVRPQIESETAPGIGTLKQGFQAVEMKIQRIPRIAGL